MILKPENIKYSLLTHSLVEANEDFRNFVIDSIKRQSAEGTQYGAHTVPQQFWTKADDGTDGSDGKGNYFTEIRINMDILDNENVECEVSFSEETG